MILYIALPCQPAPLENKSNRNDRVQGSALGLQLIWRRDTARAMSWLWVILILNATGFDMI